ncbi:MAG: sulfatase-like hydrolase/transferase, partial [Spirochaetia bacterium]|nr:sulfatase-like hydrolase/transferase [Spirochaetia bacterium]
YRTGMFGKNHLFRDYQLPEIWDTLDERLVANGEGVEGRDKAFSAVTLDPAHPFNITERLTSGAMEFMAQKSDKPFLCWINYQDPHPLFMAPEPYANLFPPNEVTLPKSYFADESTLPYRCRVWRDHSEMETCSEEDAKKAIAMYMGQIRYVDDMVGRLHRALEEGGILENTVVVFMSDHGELLGDFKMFHKLPVFYDSLTRIPLIVRTPDRLWKTQKVRSLVEEVDLAPTFLELLGQPVPHSMVGRSFHTSLVKGADEGKESVLCQAGFGAPTWKKSDPNLKLKAPFPPTAYGPGAMIRKGAFKLSYYADDLCQLFNLEEDPLEMKNLFENERFRGIRLELQEELLKRLLSVKTRDIGRLDWVETSRDYMIDPRSQPLESWFKGMPEK